MRIDIATALAWATTQLANISTTPQLDSQVLLGFVLNCKREWLLAHGEEVLSAEQHDAFASLVTRRTEGEPLAYITGTQEFYGLDFAVSPAVLIPRPETEQLVETVLKWAAKQSDRLPHPRILEIGTGSGCIATVLKKKLPRAEVHATDIDPDALAVARANAKTHQANITFYEGDLFKALPASLHGQFDCIVSNPPYVHMELVTADAPETISLKYEPQHALTPATHPMAIIEQILTEAPGWLQRNGMLCMEIGSDQGQTTLTAAQNAFENADIRIVQDLTGRDRIAAIQDL